MIKSKLLTKYKYISHGFFNSSGGYSQGIYKSLNCGLGSKDRKKIVNLNLKKVCKLVGCKKKNLVLLNQKHSNKVHLINKITKKKLDGDSLITNKEKIALGILTADCAPVFIYDQKTKFICALHAGWKGAYKKIITKTIYNFKKKGSEAKNLIAVVGPCIKKSSYEVKTDFLRKFTDQNNINKKFFKFKNKKIFFSLDEYIKNQLKINGVKFIEIIKKY